MPKPPLPPAAAKDANKKARAFAKKAIGPMTKSLNEAKAERKKNGKKHTSGAEGRLRGMRRDLDQAKMLAGSEGMSDAEIAKKRAAIYKKHKR